jgi:hypothetical protein
MIDELERYQYEITESGLVRYGAPDGFHDDTVISLALANWAADVPPSFIEHATFGGFNGEALCAVQHAEPYWRGWTVLLFRRT